MTKRSLSGDFLQQMAVASRERVRAARAACPQAELLARAMATPSPPRLRLQAGGFDLIAELKLRSPAAGALKGPRGGRGHARDGLRARGRRRRIRAHGAHAVRRQPGSSAQAAQALAAARRARDAQGFPGGSLPGASRLARPGRAACSSILRMLPRAELEALVDGARAGAVRAARGVR